MTSVFTSAILVAVSRTKSGRTSILGALKSPLPNKTRGKEEVMTDSVYKVIELVGTSTESWEKAAKAAVDRASKSLRDLRIAEVALLDMQLKDGKIEAYRARVKVSFKYEGGD